jgi:hypothetical protein
MTWTRAQYLDRVRRAAIAEESEAWDDAAEVLPLLGLVHAREWKAVLDVNPYYRWAERGVTVDASTSRVAKSALAAGAGDSQQRLYRVLAVRNATVPYRPADAADMTTAVASGSGTGVWWEQGTDLQFLPGDSGRALTVAVNYTPTRADDLSADAVAVDWPEDYEMLLVWETAALLLAKGGAETEAAADVRAMSLELRERLHAEAERLSTRPREWRYSDTSDVWGSY